MTKNLFLGTIALATLFSPVLIKRAESQVRASEAFMDEAIARNLQENSPAKMVRKQYWNCAVRFRREPSMLDWFQLEQSLNCQLTLDEWRIFKTVVGDFYFYF